MALLQENRNTDADFSGATAHLQGFRAVRKVSALVAEILRKANNFFITGARGFESMGIDPSKAMQILQPYVGKGKDKKINPDFDAQKSMAFIPKVAQVIVLLTCSEEELDLFDDDSKNLDKACRDLMKKFSSAEIMAQMPFVQEEFNKVNRSTATLPEEEAPEVELGPGIQKKLDRAG